MLPKTHGNADSHTVRQLTGFQSQCRLHIPIHSLDWPAEVTAPAYVDSRALKIAASSVLRHGGSLTWRNPGPTSRRPAATARLCCLPEQFCR